MDSRRVFGLFFCFFLVGIREAKGSSSSQFRMQPVFPVTGLNERSALLKSQGPASRAGEKKNKKKLHTHIIL